MLITIAERTAIRPPQEEELLAAQQVDPDPENPPVVTPNCQPGTNIAGMMELELDTSCIVRSYRVIHHSDVQGAAWAMRNLLTLSELLLHGTSQGLTTDA